MVHRLPVEEQGGNRSRPFVRQHHGVAAVQDGGHQCGRGDDRRHRHVAVQKAQFVRAPDEGIDLAGDPGDREPGDGGGVFDGVEPFARRMDHAERGIGHVLR